MILYFVRYRPTGEQDWQSWKFTHASGRLRAYLAVTASRQVLKQVSAALDYALTGTPSPLLHEVALQLGDHGGHTWLIQRRGKETRIAKDGALCAAADAERDLAEACLDGQLTQASSPWSANERLTVGHFDIRSQSPDGDDQAGLLRLMRLGAPVSPEASLKAAAEAQITAVAGACAQRFACPALATAKNLASLGRKLDPLRLRYSELCRQYNELKGEAQGLLGKDGNQCSSLMQEVELLDQLAAAAEPLLQPGVSLKALQSDLAKVTAERAELRHQLGLSSEQQTMAVDFHAAISGLSHIEAQARLIQAMGKARQQVAEQIEPLFRRYLEVAAGGLTGDQQTQAELASCLASLTARLKQKAHLQQVESLHADKQKTWFDRFKSRSETPGAQFEETPLEREVTDLETAHMAITYTLGRLSELKENLALVDKKHDAALATIDATYEQLVQGFGTLKQRWQVLAGQSHLAEDIDLNNLLKLAAGHGTLTELEAKHHACGDKLQRFHTALNQVERLLLDWRKATGSQKTVDLSSPAILLSEVSSLLRYRETKRQRLTLIKDQAVAAKAAAGMLAMLKKRRQAIASEWTAAFAAAGVPALEIHDEAVSELCSSAQLIDALTSVRHTASKAKPAGLFTGAAHATHPTEAFALTVYHWDEEHTQAKERLAFLAALEQATEDTLHVLLLADESLAMALAPAGLGRAVSVPTQVQAQAGQSATPHIPGAPKPTPNVIKAPQQQQRQANTQPPTASSGLLSDKARHTLAMLTTRKS